MIAKGIIRALIDTPTLPFSQRTVWPELLSPILTSNAFPLTPVDITVKSDSASDVDSGVGAEEVTIGGIHIDEKGNFSNFIATVIMNGTNPVTPVFNTPDVSTGSIIRINPHLYKTNRVGSSAEQAGTITVNKVGAPTTIIMTTETSIPGASGAYFSIPNGSRAIINAFGASYGIAAALQGEARVDVDLLSNELTTDTQKSGPRNIAQKVILSRTSVMEIDVKETIEGPADVYATISRIELSAPAAEVEVTAWILFSIR